MCDDSFVARIGAGLFTVGTVLMIVGSLAPWVTSLGVSANSWDLRDLVLTLGFGDNGAFEIAVTLWVIVPIVLVASVATAWWGRIVRNAILGAIGALYGGIVAFAVLQAPEIDAFSVEWGVALTFVAALVVLAAVMWQIGVLIGGRSESAPDGGASPSGPS